MAGLESQNISVASTKLSGPSISDRDICVFCRRRATPSASDPHAPLFPFFSLVDCRHYACQPCALVHCDNAGRCILCPQCNCVSRLAQSGRRRNRSSSSAQDMHGDGGSVAGGGRVFIDDGVSSVRSNRSATTRVSPHRSALKSQSGSSKKRSSSVQFPANPTTSIVDADGADAGGNDKGRRERSPLTQDAVASLPVDPSEARRQRVRDQQQRRALQADKSVSLYAITAEPPKPLTATMSGEAAPAAAAVRRSKERSHSQPAPKLPNTILEPKQVFPVPPPLVLHTVDEYETTGAAVDAAGTADNTDHYQPADELSVSDPIKKPVEGQCDSHQEPETLSPLHRAQLDDCETAENEERSTLEAVEAHNRAKLRQTMEEAETAIHARRGLELEFESTPLPTLPDQALADLSDQVSATSDDELSQRSSAHKAGGGGSSRHNRHRTPRNSTVADSEEAAAATAARQVNGEMLTKAETPANNTTSAAKLGVGTASAVDTPSPMTAARVTCLSDAEDEMAKLPSEAAKKAAEEAAAAAEVAAAQAQRVLAVEAQERRARDIITQEAAEGAEELRRLHKRAVQQHQRMQERREREALEEQQLFAAQQDRMLQLELRIRDQLTSEAAEERQLLQRQEDRERQHLRHAHALREQEAEQESQLHQLQVRDRTSQQEERDTFARRSLEDREALEREALSQTEAAVRVHYERNAEKWRTVLIPHALAAQRRARAAAELAQLQTSESAQRSSVASEEDDEWAWLISGARVDRVVAATEESERVQREYEELRYERLVQQFYHDAAALVAEEQRGRRTFEEYETTTRHVLQSQCRLQRDAAAQEEERLRREAAQRAAVRRDMALQQRFQREREDLEADEGEARAVVREEEREERRTANIVFVQGLAALRRRELLAHLSSAACLEEETQKAKEAEVAAQAEAAATAAVLLQQQQQQRQEEQQIQQTEVSRNSADHLEELRVRQEQYEADMRAAMQRLQEAERRVAEEASIRIKAEEERRATQAESDRLLREAEQRAEQRIRDARDTAERLMQAQLADVRDEAARRAEHAAVMQALAEEEQRAVLEAKLQAAERQLQQAEQRAAEEVQRARSEAAEMAAAEAARAAREAQQREAEWQEHARAEKLLWMAEQESEKADAIRRLSELEARAAEAVQRACEEAARSAAAMEERIAAMERRQQAREAEVLLASQRLQNARESMRDFHSRSQSSLHTTPSRVERRVADSPQQQQHQLQGFSSRPSSRHASASPAASQSRSEGDLVASVAAAAPVSPTSQRSAQTPPLVPSPATPAAAVVSTPPQIVLGARVRTPPSSASAQWTTPTAFQIRQQQQQQLTPLSPAVLAHRSGAGSGGGLYAFDPADVVRAAIREAVMEIVAAQQRAQSLQDQAEQHIELSERRYRRQRSDRLQAAHEVAELESSRVQRELGERPLYQDRDPSLADTRSRRPSATKRAAGDLAVDSYNAMRASLESAKTPSLGSESAHLNGSEESPLAPSSVPSPGAAAGTVPLPSGTAAVAAATAVSGSGISNTVSNTSSVYFDDQPCRTADDGRGNAAGTYAAPSAAVPPHRAASRVLFQGHHSHLVYDALAGGAHAGRTQLEERYSGGGEAHYAHMYNEPEPSKPDPESPGYSPPPPRRSTTRADTDDQATHSAEDLTALKTKVPKTSTVTTVPSSGVLPQQSLVCPRCYGDDTTTTCWRCGEVICRHCGLRPESARKLCCSAQLRAQLREYTRQQQQRQQQMTIMATQSRRGDQQVQTSFNSSSGDTSENVISKEGARHTPNEARVNAPDRCDAETSTWVPQEPPSMIPPSAYYRASLPHPQQQQYYFDHPSMHANPVSVAAMTAAEPLAYLSGSQRMPFAYPSPYPSPQIPPWTWQQQPQQSQAQEAPSAQDAVRSSLPPEVVVPSLSQQHPPSQPVSQRVVDVTVEDDDEEQRSSCVPRTGSALPGAPQPPADSTTHRMKSSLQEQRRTSSAVPTSAVARGAPPPQESNTAQPPKTAHITTPVKHSKQAEEAEDPLASTPTDSPTARQEPKTERKRAPSAFFVSLDGGAEEEPRRPKPPTPRNYMPMKMFPPDAVRAASAAMRGLKGMKKPSPPSPPPPVASTRGQSSSGGGGGANGRRASPPIRAQPIRSALHDPYAARGKHNARPQRRASPSPYVKAHPSNVNQPQEQQRPSMRPTRANPQPVIASYMKVVAPMHPRFAEARKGSPAAAADNASKPQCRSPSADSCSSYPTSTSSTSPPPASQRATTTQSAVQRVAEARGDGRAPQHPHRPCDDLHRHDGVDAGGFLPQRPHLQSSQRMQKADPSYYSYSSFSTAASETHRVPQGRRQDFASKEHQQQHRYAARWSDPSTISLNAPDRRVPTLAELDRRLQQLREQDDYEAAQYQQRQSRLWRNASPQQWQAQCEHEHQHAYPAGQQQVHVLLQSPRSRVPWQMHRSRSPKQRIVSPPWRTDLNASPLRPRWDISQPRSPLYHPPAATAGR
jgi:hypothetical protein